MAKKKRQDNIVTDNRKARHDYFIEDTFEAGIVLTGTEVKSLRQGKANLKDSYVRIENGEAFLYNAHISAYEQGNRFNHEPVRKRKLLFHKREIIRLWSKVKEKGLTLVPLKIYFKQSHAKVEVALARGKHQYDKRQAIAERDAKRQIERNLRSRN